MRLPLTKMQGCGNDFLFVDSMTAHPPEFYPSEVRYLCDRHFGVGADGLVVLSGSEEAHAKWKFYNSDGSEAEMCGNAARCTIRFLQDRYFPEFEVISFMTKAGVIKGRKIPDTGNIEITLLAKGDQKFNYEQLTLKTEKNTFEGYWIDTGVPHFVMEVKDLATYPIQQVGKLLRHHPAFGEAGSNVTFFQCVVGNRLKATTYERGVEKETLACGTGVAAAAIVHSELYLQPFPIEVAAPGGDLVVDLSPVSRLLVLQGPAEYVMECTVQEVPHNFEPPVPYSERKKG